MAASRFSPEHHHQAVRTGKAGFALLFFIGGWRLAIRGGSAGLWFSAHRRPERGIRLRVSSIDSGPLSD